MREQFEKLHWVSVELKSKKLTFNKKINQYACLGGSATLRADPINLAWYAFQEQQKRIIEVLKLLNETYPYELDTDTIFKIAKIKELLK